MGQFHSVIRRVILWQLAFFLLTFSFGKRPLTFPTGGGGGGGRDR